MSIDDSPTRVGCSSTNSVCQTKDALETTATKATPPPASPPSRKRRISFSGTVDIREMPHVNDLTKDEVASTWFCQEEFDAIKKNLVVTVRCIMAKKPMTNDQCIRGLEFRTPLGAKLRKQNKINALTAVWNEQVGQWKSDVVNDEAIRQVYVAQTVECNAAALKLASLDERESRRYLETDPNLSSSCLSVDSASLSTPVPQSAVPDDAQETPVPAAA